MAGLRGVTGVGVSVKGVTEPGKDAEIHGVPFAGKIYIGKGTLLKYMEARKAAKQSARVLAFSPLPVGL
jgi:hypothetical protein